MCKKGRKATKKGSCASQASVYAEHWGAKAVGVREGVSLEVIRASVIIMANRRRQIVEQLSPAGDHADLEDGSFQNSVLWPSVIFQWSYLCLILVFLPDLLLPTSRKSARLAKSAMCVVSLTSSPIMFRWSLCEYKCSNLNLLRWVIARQLFATL